MQDFNFKIEGIEEINKILDTLPKAINDKIQADLNKQAANIVKKELQALSPEGNNDKKHKSKISANVVVKKSINNSFLIGFTKKVWYVKLLEMGTIVRKTLGKGRYRSGANRGVLIRKPFIESAHHTAAQKAVEFLRTNYLKIVDRSIRKLAKQFK
jgi:HK97 gp10 family phage protein